MSAVTRRVAGGFAAWLGVLGVVALAVHPEPCVEVTRPEIHRSAERAVGWFAMNRLEDGTYLYRYDRDRDAVEPGYNDLRHAGVMLSLYQAAGAGIDGALAAADHGRAYVDRHLVTTVVGPAFGRGSRLKIGGTALVVSALDERWAATGSATAEDQELLLELGRSMQAAVGPKGEVIARLDIVDGPIVGTTSLFYTGQVAWALARLHLRFPSEGFDASAERIRRYVVEERDELERDFPIRPDHWMAYAVATMATWPTPPTGSGEADWLDRQLGLYGLQVRYESQRQGGITSITRGTPALAAGVGTLGEGLAGHLAVPEAVQGRVRATALERLRCVAGLLVSRQADGDDPRIAGAWFRKGDTQMDDQQHALSALLLTEALLEAEPPDGEETG